MSEGPGAPVGGDGVPVGGVPPEVRAYLAAFAGGRFYEAHEALEGLWWAADSDPFLQGLILLAAAHCQLQRGRPAGAARHFRAVCRYLEGYRPRHAGFDVDAIVAHAENAAALLLPYLRPSGRPPARVSLEQAVAPFVFAVGPEAAGLGAARDRPAAAPLDPAISSAVAARRAAGEPVGPASWGALVKEVTLLTGGRVPRAQVRAAVRRALGPPGA